MVDDDRIRELEREIGSEDVAAIMALFVEEASATIAKLAGGLEDADHARAIHFLRSGALNIGLTGFAREAEMAGDVSADSRPSAAAALRVALDKTRAFLPRMSSVG
ncbi:MAG: hypothetical protein AAF919_12255 [Pseudomonadota bacterium]